MRRAILIVDHGSRRSEANALLDAVAERVRARATHTAFDPSVGSGRVDGALLDPHPSLRIPVNPASARRETCRRPHVRDHDDRDRSGEHQVTGIEVKGAER